MPHPSEFILSAARCGQYPFDAAGFDQLLAHRPPDQRVYDCFNLPSAQRPDQKLSLSSVSRNATAGAYLS